MHRNASTRYSIPKICGDKTQEIPLGYVEWSFNFHTSNALTHIFSSTFFLHIPLTSNHLTHSI